MCSKHMNIPYKLTCQCWKSHHCYMYQQINQFKDYIQIPVHFVHEDY